MRKKLGVVITSVGLLLAVAPAWAHHAFTAEFDAKRPIKLRGTVAKVELINPHSWIHVDVKNADRTTTRWMTEAGTPNTQLHRGLPKKDLPIGQEILEDAYQ